MKAYVVYQLRRLIDEDPNEWQTVTEVACEFDTQYSMPGNPFRIMEDGEWYVAERTEKQTT